jgi:hypothetical protein
MTDTMLVNMRPWWHATGAPFTSSGSPSPNPPTKPRGGFATLQAWPASGHATTSQLTFAHPNARCNEE